MSDGGEWWTDLDPEQVDRVHALVAQAAGCLESALEELDGDGGEVRDDLAEAYQLASFNEVGLKGARSLTRGENESRTVATYSIGGDTLRDLDDEDGGEDA